MFDTDKYEFEDGIISCEGYDSTQDTFILENSCGFEYTLLNRSPSTPRFQKGK